MLNSENRDGLPFGQPIEDPPEFAETEITDAVYADELGRKIAFPVHYLPKSHEAAALTTGYKPGRLYPFVGSGDDIRPDIYEIVCPQDVLMIHAYSPAMNPDEVMAVLKDVGSQIYAVLIGQWAFEMGNIHHIADGTDEAREASVLQCVEFVKRRGGELRDIGVRPAFGLTHFQTLIHTYWAPEHMPGGVDPLIEALEDLDALVIDFLGFAFWLSKGVMQPLDHWDPGGRIMDKKYLDEWPFAQLKEWHERVECWGAVDYMRGLRSCNDVLMAAGGFKAGVVGQLPAGSLDGIVEPEQHA